MSLINFCLNHIRTWQNCFIRDRFICSKQRKRLQNKDFSIISSNCNGGVISHDLGVRFNSPTINLYMSAQDYLKLSKNLEYYMQADLQEIKDTEFSFPVGLLGGEIKLYFQHYKNFEEAKTKWIQRAKRVNLKNLFFITTDRDGADYDFLKEIDALPYPNKLIFTAKEYPDISCAVYCPEFEKDGCVGIMSDFCGWNGKRCYDKYFDFVEWLNKGAEK